MTPPPTRQQTPASPIVSSPPTTKEPNIGNGESDGVPETEDGYMKGMPTWGVVLVQVVVTLPLYLFAYWAMVEGIKAGGDTLINCIDYLAFRP